ncbi:unnamed protein product, partial [Prorocentrum cordatum]
VRGEDAMGLGHVPLQAYVKKLSGGLEDTSEAVDFFGMGSGKATSRVVGQLIQYSGNKGFVFILPPAGGPHVFAHRADSGGCLEELELGSDMFFVKEWDDRKGRHKMVLVCGRIHGFNTEMSDGSGKMQEVRFEGVSRLEFEQTLQQALGSKKAEGILGLVLKAKDELNIEDG